MKVQIIINLSSAEYGYTRNYLVFKCTYSCDRLYTHNICFSWSDIDTDMSLSNEELETLKNMLKGDYNSSFDIDKARA